MNTKEISPSSAGPIWAKLLDARALARAAKNRWNTKKPITVAMIIGNQIRPMIAPR